MAFSRHLARKNNGHDEESNQENLIKTKPHITYVR